MWGKSLFPEDLIHSSDGGWIAVESFLGLNSTLRSRVTRVERRSRPTANPFPDKTCLQAARESNSCGPLQRRCPGFCAFEAGGPAPPALATFLAHWLSSLRHCGGPSSSGCGSGHKERRRLSFSRQELKASLRPGPVCRQFAARHPRLSQRRSATKVRRHGHLATVCALVDRCMQLLSRFRLGKMPWRCGHGLSIRNNGQAEDGGRGVCILEASAKRR